MLETIPTRVLDPVRCGDVSHHPDESCARPAGAEQHAVEVREELLEPFCLRTPLGGGDQRAHDFHAEACNFELVLGRDVGEGRA